ncbi:MAG TPA: hypothetical protein VMF69_00355 [Gemmataceae bacterium]|nr:hypothetical protein [Gemmataceae bacterium]
MKRWKWFIVTPTLILLVLAGSAWIILPRFYPENTATSWTYHSPKYDYSLTLPSSDWQEIKKEDSDAAFYNRKRSTLAGIIVSKGDQDTFRKAVQRMKEHIDTSKGEQLTTPQFSEGKTEAGDPFAYWTVEAKVDKGGAVFLAISLVWRQGKGLIIRAMMEGSLVMRSNMGKKTELEYFDKVGKTICLSIR